MGKWSDVEANEPSSRISQLLTKLAVSSPVSLHSLLWQVSIIGTLTEGFTVNDFGVVVVYKLFKFSQFRSICMFFIHYTGLHVASYYHMTIVRVTRVHLLKKIKMISIMVNVIVSW